MIPSIDGTVRMIPLFVNADIGTVPNQVLETLRVLKAKARYKKGKEAAQAVISVISQ